MIDFKIKKIGYDEVKEWCLYKHYAHRIPSISYAFGLYDNQTLVAICTFGVPASASLVDGAFGGNYKDQFYELNRLCANDGLPKNTLSFFVGGCLKMLPKPMVVVSYADSGQNHHGYIYQATNWIYTGMSEPRRDSVVIGAENKHARHMTDHLDKSNQKKRGGAIEEAKKRGEVIVVERSRKYRYFYLLGDKRQIREMKRNLKYPIIKEYPKGDNIRYDASYQPSVQLTLF